MNKFIVLTLTTALALAACGKVNKQSPENPTNPQPTGAPASSAPAPDSAAPASQPAPAPTNDPPPTANFADPKLQHGYDVFQKWCAPCHAPGPRHPGTQALAAKYKGAQPDALEQRKDLTPDLVKYFVRNGVSIMPPFRKTEITDQELDDLGAYLSHPH